MGEIKPQVRMGLIGYGAWGSHHARAIASNSRAQLVAIAARTPASLERAKTDHPQAAAYLDYREMLRRESLDAAVIVLPSDLHFDAATAVLESGLHLLLEKPMALTVPDCKAIKRLAEQKQLLLAVGHELRLSPLWGQVAHMIDSGAIGEPRYGLIELWRRPYRPGADGWRYDPARVGNWILEEPIHFFDLARFYFGSAGHPVSVTANASSADSSRPALHDNFSATLRFANGAYVLISQTLAGWEHHQTAKITGTAGAIWASWNGATDRTPTPTFSLKYQPSGGDITEIPIYAPAGEVYELHRQLDRFVGAILDGSPLPADGADGKAAVAMCLMAQASIDSGKEVRFDEWKP